MPLSYRLHAELAKEHDGEEKWGYRRIHSGQLTANGRLMERKGDDKNNDNGPSVSLKKRNKAAIDTLKAAGIPKDLDWFAPDSVSSYEEMGNPDTTAQVHPYQFTTSIAKLAEEKNAQIVLGSVTDIGKVDNKVTSATYIDKESFEKKTIPATDIIIAAGPWIKSVYPSAPVSAIRAHSVTIRPSRPVSAYALFTEIALPPGFKSNGKAAKSTRFRHGHVTPEIYARPNNEVYACGEGDTLIQLPSTTAEVEIDDSRCQDIIDYVSSISDEMQNGEVTARQACYLPHVDAAAAGPLIGETGVRGLLLAAGHTCWGIQNGPATGKLMSEFIFDGEAKSAKIGSLDPRRVI